ncbi:hypothetical protein EX349_25325 [Pseudomonas protegens]|nr:hypothetical protein [Pseudomonas sp. JV245A]NAN54534.1 hypothetical protein [Pseudomonas protegens]NUE77697.1 hypothetical protein [Pseudomonas protegens]
MDNAASLREDTATAKNKKVPFARKRNKIAADSALRKGCGQRSIVETRHLRGEAMGTVLPARPAQTLYVTIRRDELRQLKDERDQLQRELTQLRLQLQSQGQPAPLHLSSAS